MNTPSNAIHESSLGSQGIAPAIISATRPFYWSLRRELWENRLIYIVPLAAATLFLVGSLINMIALRYRAHGIWPLYPAHQGDVLIAIPHEISAALIMGTALIVGIFYSLDALYGERRDRSILFWKSLPVSDLTAVLSKLSIPLVVIPLLSFAITLVTHFIMLLLGSAVLLGSGANIAALWTQGSFVRASIEVFYHMLTVHGLWYAPIYGWLLLVSAASPRAPFIWAALPPFVICGVEKIAFNTTHFLNMLMQRLAGPSGPAMTMPAGASTDPMHLIPHHFFSEPGLWIGLAITAAFLAAAVRLRRYRGPI
jgi:ABC-2 type transport system permease protein